MIFQDLEQLFVLFVGSVITDFIACQTGRYANFHISILQCAIIFVEVRNMSDCNGNCSSCAQNCASRTQEQIVPTADTKINKIVGVLSGKGGVGKSMVSSLLAVELAEAGYHVGIMDADITGPSIPKMFGLNDRLYGVDSPLCKRMGL